MRPDLLLYGVMLCLLFRALPIHADTFPAKEDNRVICIDAKTGRLIWEYIPKKLSNVHFALYREGLVAYPSADPSDLRDPLFLDASTGKRLPSFTRNDASLLARSNTLFVPRQLVILGNGWQLADSDRRGAQTLQFRNPANGKVIWTINTDGYPRTIRSWKQYLYYSSNGLSSPEVLYAYRIRDEKPIWTIDVNGIMKEKNYKIH
jgi:outer membrane protein assembly factor BamB